jgi:hypothetical protein
MKTNAENLTHSEKMELLKWAIRKPVWGDS